MDVRVLSKLAMVACAILWTSSVQAQWPATTSPGVNGFWAEANGTVFDRPGTDLGLTLIFDSVTLAPLYTSDQITDLNSSFGGQFRFGNHHRLLGDWELGGTVANWESDANIVGANLESPFFPGFNPDEVDFLYDSRMYNLEFNLRRAFAPGMTFLIGPRYFNLADDLDFNSNTDFAGNLFQTFDTINTRNSAIGGQVGLEFNLPVAQAVYVQGHIKVAGLGNSATVERSSDTNISDPIDSTLEKGTGTFIGQTGGRVYFEVLPRHVFSYAGYEATWVDGLAVSPPQFLSTGNDVVTANTVFWHAITFGLRFEY